MLKNNSKLLFSAQNGNKSLYYRNNSFTLTNERWLFLRKKEMDLRTLGRNIAQVRRRQNLTQDSVAFDLDISKTAYSKIERGETNISFLRLVQIAEYFKVDVSELVKGSTDVDLQELAANIAQMKTDIHSIKVAMDI